MEILSGPIALRGLFQKQDCPDVRFELYRNESGFDFTMVENGKTIGLFWRALTPKQAMWGCGPMSLQEAWRTCVSKRYPDYTAAKLEEGFA